MAKRKRRNAGQTDTNTRGKRKRCVIHGDEFTTPDGLVLPMKLKKYWNRRHDFFWRFDEGIQIDEVGWYSVTPEVIAHDTAERIAQLYNKPGDKQYGRICVVDAFCGVGGNAIKFAEWCEHVVAIDIDPVRLSMAKYNAELYGVADRIEFILGDFYQLAPSLVADVVYMSPPWGGPEYLEAEIFELDKMPFHSAKEWLDRARMISPNVAYFLPRNCDVKQLADLCPELSCDIEMNFIGQYFKGITMYYNDLADICSSEARVIELDSSDLAGLPK
ncbi:Trimethylguanosine synthase [Coemansia sp. RSA 1722]|nr:Trimethylguanosine synthase [Coemansia sp. RSA 1722]